MRKNKGHLPIRTCTICRSKHIKNELIRLTLNDKGRLVRDDRGTRPGRGLYVCKRADCFEALRKRNGVSGKAFRIEGFVMLDPESRVETE